MKTTYELLQEARKRKADRLRKVNGVWTVIPAKKGRAKMIIFQDDGTQKVVELSQPAL